MDRYATGDDAAFEEVYDLLAPRLFGFLQKHMRSREKAEDLLQQTFLNICRARGTFIKGAAVLPWAFAIARCLMIDAIRRDRKEGPRRDDDAPRDDLSPAEPRSHEPAPDAMLQAQQTAQEIEARLARMPGLQREAFELVRLQGLSNADAAKILGTTVTAVKLRVFRADQALGRGCGFEPQDGDER